MNNGRTHDEGRKFTYMEERKERDGGRAGGKERYGVMKGEKVTKVSTVNHNNIFFCFLLASQPATDKQLYAIIILST